MTSDEINITSDNFSVDENGNVTAHNGTFEGGEMHVYGGTTSISKFTVTTDNTQNTGVWIVPSRIWMKKNGTTVYWISESNGKMYLTAPYGGEIWIPNGKLILDGDDGEVNCKKLLIDNEEIYQKTLLSTDKSINTTNGSYKTITGMPNLSSYAGKTVNFYVRYNTDQAKKYSFNIGNSTYLIEYVREYNGGDIWHTLFKIENTNSTSWKVTTENSYVIKDASISKVNITSSNYMFYIEKITIN